ncbi:MAG: hypothetical protein U0Y68_26110 [Blastocatellia bacterium]
MIINTDAEGRLILCDALSCAAIKLGATRIVDLATLTGAVSIALGDVYVAVLRDNQEWTESIINAGKASGEKIWRCLDREYRDQIKSEIADIKNVGGRKAGTITGAYFLREFVGDATRRGRISTLRVQQTAGGRQAIFPLSPTVYANTW